MVRAYDWEQLKKQRIVHDTLGAQPLLVLAADDGSSAFVYNRMLDDVALEFERNGDALTDSVSGSVWNQFGRCVSGPRQGTQLQLLQSYQQFVRGWLTFHPETDFYDFNH